MVELQATQSQTVVTGLAALNWTEVNNKATKPLTRALDCVSTFVGIIASIARVTFSF